MKERSSTCAAGAGGVGAETSGVVEAEPSDDGGGGITGRETITAICPGVRSGIGGSTRPSIGSSITRLTCAVTTGLLGRAGMPLVTETGTTAGDGMGAGTGTCAARLADSPLETLVSTLVARLADAETPERSGARG